MIDLDCKKCKHLVPTSIDRMNTRDTRIFPVYTCEKWECEFEEEKAKENKGEWIAYHLGAKWICSQCNEKNDSKDNFCPNCGADMRGEDKE